MINKILGLDLGSASIGWALISEDSDSPSQKVNIVDLGCRIIPYDSTEGQDFTKGTGESKNALRTRDRSTRRGYDRYQLRREYLVKTLKNNNMMPDDSIKRLPKMELWELRAKAVTEQIFLMELGRILLWLNQKRGYKSSRSSANLDKKDSEYLLAVKSRHQKIKELNVTVGQYFYENLNDNQFFRVKENVFPREAYIEEFDAICNTQKKYHSSLTDTLINHIRDEIIYYQRPLKSQKGLVSVCEFEGFYVKKDGKEYFAGPKVAQKSSPLFQVAKLWESINNIRVKTKEGDELYLTLDQKRLIYEHLDNNDKLSLKDLCKIIQKKESEIFVDRKIYKTGIQGNTTKGILRKILNEDEYKKLCKLDIKIIEDPQKKACLYNKQTGEVIDSSITNYKIIDRNVEFEPLYQLWHTIYSIEDTDKCEKALSSNFGLNKDTANKLANIDFNRFGYGNKSVKCIRKILPYLMDGYDYSDSMMYAGYNHSGSLTKDENLSRVLMDQLKLLPKNSLRQPVVEKIINQMINLVNEIIKEYGKPSEIRVELARELKQSKEERIQTENDINKRTRENEKIAKELEEYGLRATRNNIVKWRLFHEINNEEKKLSAICIYCGEQLSLAETIQGRDVDVEHIIPRSKLFDDSQSNKTLAHRHCNSTKGNQTAYDFMKGKSESEFNAYVERVNLLFEKNLISKSKRDKLLMPESKIPDNFIDRQLRETQYISRKAREILSTICHNVYCTSGSVTSELRRLWGWDDVTMTLQLPKYKKLGLTEIVSWESDYGNNQHEREVIKGWTKRDDHRHHAIDALTIACTKQGYIQKLNTLNSKRTREEIENEVKGIIYNEKLSSMEKYLISKQPLTVKEVEEAVSKILISYKTGKRVISKGTRKSGSKGNKRIVQRGIIIPRGKLSEEHVYGKVKVVEKDRPLKYLFENPDLIVKDYIKNLVIKRLEENDNNPKIAYSSTLKNPILIKNNIPLKYASCYKEEYVIKYPVDQNFNKVDKVIDNGAKNILNSRLAKFNDDPKKAFKDVSTSEGKSIRWYEDESLNKPIYSVRCLTGLSAVVPVKRDEQGREIGFVKPGNNHHVAIYYDKDGNLFEHVCTFWHAVERKKFALPAIIENSDEIWDLIMESPSGKFNEPFLKQLPPPGSKLKLSIQQNEMFILGLPEEELQYALVSEDYATLSNYLYRVQKISSMYYVFRHHLETQLIDTKEYLSANRFYRITSFKSLLDSNPYKLKINILGKINLDQKNLIF